MTIYLIFIKGPLRSVDTQQVPGLQTGTLTRIIKNKAMAISMNLEAVILPNKIAFNCM